MTKTRKLFITLFISAFFVCVSILALNNLVLNNKKDSDIKSKISFTKDEVDYKKLQDKRWQELLDYLGVVEFTKTDRKCLDLLYAPKSDDCVSTFLSNDPLKKEWVNLNCDKMPYCGEKLSDNDCGSCYTKNFASDSETGFLQYEVIVPKNYNRCQELKNLIK
jgi:hypothetical protein